MAATLTPATRPVCPNCTSIDQRPAGLAIVSSILQIAGGAAVGVGGLLLGLIALVLLPAVGAIMLAVMIVSNLVVLTIAIGSIVIAAARLRGKLQCRHCELIWDPRQPTTERSDVQLPVSAGNAHQATPEPAEDPTTFRAGKVALVIVGTVVAGIAAMFAVGFALSLFA